MIHTDGSPRRLLSEEDIWYFKYSGYYLLPDTLPEDLIDRLNEVTTTQVQKMIEPIVWENKEERKAASVRRLSKILDRSASATAESMVITIFPIAPLVLIPSSKKRT